MTDREILLVVYGAMKAQDDADMREILELVEAHLFPNPVIKSGVLGEVETD